MASRAINSGIGESSPCGPIFMSPNLNLRTEQINGDDVTILNVNSSPHHWPQDSWLSTLDNRQISAFKAPARWHHFYNWYPSTSSTCQQSNCSVFIKAFDDQIQSIVQQQRTSYNWTVLQLKCGQTKGVSLTLQDVTQLKVKHLHLGLVWHLPVENISEILQFEGVIIIHDWKTLLIKWRNLRQVLQHGEKKIFTRHYKDKTTEDMTS